MVIRMMVMMVIMMIKDGILDTVLSVSQILTYLGLKPQENSMRTLL